jgi:hypothetical protein
MATPVTLRDVAQTRAPFSTWVGVVLLFLIFGAIVLAVVGPMPRKDDYEGKRAKARLEKLKTQREEDAKALTTYDWIDKTKGVARVPIERAMELTISELARKQPAPAYPIATPAPQASPAGSASPPPATTPSPGATGTQQATSVSGPKSEAAGQPAGGINPPVPPAQSPVASPSPSATKSP